MLKTLTLLQSALGALLLVPAGYFLCHTSPTLKVVVDNSKTNVIPIANRMDRLATVMTQGSSHLNTIAQKSMEIAALLARIPLPLGPIVPCLKTISGSCTNLAGTMLESASGLRTSSIIVSDTPQAIEGVRNTGTAISVVAILAGIVIILNARQLMLLLDQLDLPQRRNHSP